MDEDLLKRSLAFHGMDLVHTLSTRQKMNPQNPDHAVTAKSKADFRSKLLAFIAKKADILYKRTETKLRSPPRAAETEDAYAVVTPIESFMGLPDDVRKKRFFESVEMGDVLVGVVVSVHSDGVIIALLCTDNRKCRSLDSLKILSFCPERELPRLYSSENAMNAYQIRDKVRGHVISCSAQTEKIILSLMSPTDQNLESYPKMGLISENDFPLYYRRQMQIRGLTYNELLHSVMAFHNTKNISHLCSELGLQEDMSTYSLMQGLHRLQIPETQFSESLHKAQNMRLATKHVAEGVEFFRSHRYFEAIQYFNKALQIEPKHVDALVARGALYANNENYIRAIEDFEAAVEIKPDHPNASKYLNQTLIEKGIEAHKDKNFDEAGKTYARALKIQPNRKDVQIYLKFAQMKEPFPDISKIPDTVLKRKKEPAASSPVAIDVKSIPIPGASESDKPKVKESKSKETKMKMKSEETIVKSEKERRTILMTAESAASNSTKGAASNQTKEPDILANSTKLLKTLIKKDSLAKNSETLKVKLHLKDGERKIKLKEEVAGGDDESDNDALELLYRESMKKKQLTESSSDESDYEVEVKPSRTKRSKRRSRSSSSSSSSSERGKKSRKKSRQRDKSRDKSRTDGRSPKGQSEMSGSDQVDKVSTGSGLVGYEASSDSDGSDARTDARALQVGQVENVKCGVSGIIPAQPHYSVVGKTHPDNINLPGGAQVKLASTLRGVHGLYVHGLRPLPGTDNAKNESVPKNDPLPEIKSHRKSTSRSRSHSKPRSSSKVAKHQSGGRSGKNERKNELTSKSRSPRRRSNDYYRSSDDRSPLRNKERSESRGRGRSRSRSRRRSRSRSRGRSRSRSREEHLLSRNRERARGYSRPWQRGRGRDSSQWHYRRRSHSPKEFNKFRPRGFRRGFRGRFRGRFPRRFSGRGRGRDGNWVNTRYQWRRHADSDMNTEDENADIDAAPEDGDGRLDERVAELDDSLEKMESFLTHLKQNK